MDKVNCAEHKKRLLLSLKDGLEIEYQALDLYRGLLPRLSDKVAINVIETIIVDEQKHIRLVEDLMACLNQQS